MQLLNIWGHSYEFHDRWELADSICSILGNKEAIWYAQTIELIDYLSAIMELRYENGTVFNPAEDISVWVKNDKGDFTELKPQERMSVPFQTSFLENSAVDSLYPDHATSIAYHGDWTKVHYSQCIASFKEAPLHTGDIVFVGNSITEQGGDWGKRLGMDNVRNRGIAGDVTDGVLKRLDEITHYKPRVVFLLIGINDLFNLHYQKQIPSTEYVANNIVKITELIHEKSPETKIYLQTILPTSEDYMIENINKVNAQIKRMEEDSAYELIDLHTVFVGEKGLIKQNLTSDGTHLNEAGYEQWVASLRQLDRISGHHPK